MESDWHQRTWEEGLGSMGISACARLDYLPSAILTNCPDDLWHGVAQVLQWSPIGGGVEILTYSGIPIHAKTFPYGYAVH